MSRSRTDSSTTSKPPLRLRVPSSLAVALLGASASVAMTVGACDDSIPEPVDAGQINKRFDAGVDASDAGSETGQGSDAAVALGPDAGATPDAYVPPPDAYDAPPDARPDASVPPDAPEV